MVFPADSFRSNQMPTATSHSLVGLRPRSAPIARSQIAALSGMPLKIAAKVDRADQAYWENVIRPMVEAYPDVEFIGEIDENDKARFLGGAAALLFPIDWPEPFGLVMIEAMACGTPVIAYRRGSVPEIIEENVSGFVVDTIDEAVTAVRRVASLDRAKVRAQFERRFTVERMARDYLDIYRRLLSARRRPAQFGMLNGTREGWRAVRSSPLAPNPMERDVALQTINNSSTKRSFTN